MAARYIYWACSSIIVLQASIKQIHATPVNVPDDGNMATGVDDGTWREVWWIMLIVMGVIVVLLVLAKCSVDCYRRLFQMLQYLLPCHSILQDDGNNMPGWAIGLIAMGVIVILLVVAKCIVDTRDCYRCCKRCCNNCCCGGEDPLPPEPNCLHKCIGCLCNMNA